MSSKQGYCIWCGEDISVYGYEAHSQDILWERCKNPRCQGSRIDVKTDPMGFVLEPPNMRDRYIYSKRRRGERL